MCETESAEFEQVVVAISGDGCPGMPVRAAMNQTVAETVLRGGPIMTLDPRRPVVDALAVRAGRITRSGTIEEIAPLIGRLTEVIELHGHAVVPGFIDCHTHMGLGSFPAHRITEVGLSKRTHSWQSWACEAQTEPELPIVFAGWFPMLYGGNPDEINAISPGRGCPEKEVDF